MSEKSKKIDPNSRDYDFQDIDIDPRFKVCKKEFFICCGIFAVFAAAMLFCVFVIGGGDPREYSYICGMPSWYFAVIAVCIVTAVAVSVILDKFFQHMSLEPDGELEKKN